MATKHHRRRIARQWTLLVSLIGNRFGVTLGRLRASLGVSRFTLWRDLGAPEGRHAAHPRPEVAAARATLEQRSHGAARQAERLVLVEEALAALHFWCADGSEIVRRRPRESSSPAPEPIGSAVRSRRGTNPMPPPEERIAKRRVNAHGNAGELGRSWLAE